MAESDEDKTPAREKIVEYAQGLYDYFRTPGGVIYAQRTGHPVARPMKAQGSQNVMSHRQELIIGMRRDAVGSFSGTALKEALEILEAEAFDSPARPVHTRVGSCAKAPGVTWLDLGRDDGQSVRIAPGEWTVRRPTPDEVTWRRTAMTGELPMPVREQGFDGVDALLGLCNFKDGASAALAIAFLVGCLEPDVPVPAPFLTGPQGAGKSTAGRMLVRVVEGMTGDLRRPPKDEESLITAASAGWVTGLDNLSHLTADMSDLMCCVITGAENVKRALYSDGDVVRQTLRRPVLLTGIDVGVLRPDLAERLLAMKLERPTVRRSEADIWSAFTEALPATLGSLLDVTAAVRAADCDVPEDLRMADFARLCGRLDKAYSLGALDAYRAALDDLNDDVIEGD
ncbi:ATP-binding protein, partial [Kitasatospora sp. NPDC001309]|uniref:ATP-binding protein n=1 Tax=Kitasatospora sp. NPDC001309 TaxID=3364013 RepID=UPI0036A78709